MTKKHFRGFKKFTKKRRKYQKGGNCCDYEPDPFTRSGKIDCQNRNLWTRRNEHIDHRNIWFTIVDPSGNINVIYHVIKHMDSFFNQCNENDMPTFQARIRYALSSQRHLVPWNTKTNETREINDYVVDGKRSRVVFTRYNPKGPLTIFQIVPVDQNNEPDYFDGNNYMFETRKTSITKKLLDSKLTDIEFDDNNYGIMKIFKMLNEEKVGHLRLSEKIGGIYSKDNTKTFYRNLFGFIKRGEIAVNNRSVSEITVRDFLQFVFDELDKNPSSIYINAIINNDINAVRADEAGYYSAAKSPDDSVGESTESAAEQAGRGEITIEEKLQNATNNGLGAGEGYSASAASAAMFSKMDLGEDEAKADDKNELSAAQAEAERNAAEARRKTIEGTANELRKKTNSTIPINSDRPLSKKEARAAAKKKGGRTKIKKTRKRKKIRGKTTRRM